MRRTPFLLGLVAAVVATAVAVGVAGAAADRAYAGPPSTLTIAYQPGLGYAPLSS